MDSEIKQLLEKNLEVAEESLKILKKLHRGFIWGRAFFLVKWLLILTLLWIGYVQIQPYLDTLLEVYTNLPKVLPGS